MWRISWLTAAKFQIFPQILEHWRVPLLKQIQTSQNFNCPLLFVATEDHSKKESLTNKNRRVSRGFSRAKSGLTFRETSVGPSRDWMYLIPSETDPWIWGGRWRRVNIMDYSKLFLFQHVHPIQLQKQIQQTICDLVGKYMFFLVSSLSPS